MKTANSRLGGRVIPEIVAMGLVRLRSSGRISGCDYVGCLVLSNVEFVGSGEAEADDSSRHLEHV